LAYGKSFLTQCIPSDLNSSLAPATRSAGTPCARSGHSGLDQAKEAQEMKQRKLLVVVALVALLASAPGLVSGVPVDPPTVDGCFYSSQACGDDHKWPLLAEALGGRGKLFGLQDGNTLYVAVEVASSVNDNVFGTKGQDGPYMASAGWNAVHTADRLLLSDNVQVEVRCGPHTWNWYNGYAYDADGDQNPAEHDWLSGPGDNSIGGGTPPPGLASATTLQRNLNSSTWDVTLGGTRSGSGAWKSPDGGTIGDVTDDGWPTYNGVYDWEWAMVYEMSLDVSSCGENAITVEVISAHNSPSKDGDEDVPIEFADWGDAPDPNYPTLLSSSGARHFLPVSGQGPCLGQVVDKDLDGQPSAGAVGDDNDADGDDEDGVCFCAGPVVPGTATHVRVDTLGSPQACTLSAWIDWNGNGSWADAGDQMMFTSGPGGGYPTANPVLPAGGVYHMGYTVPAGATPGVTYARFRCTTAGPVGYTGAAPDGEMEDYELLISGVPVEFGDLPDGYGTLFGSGGAFHYLISPLVLGAQADGEGNGNPTYDSEGDDTCGPGGDDEDGATAGGDWNDGQAELNISVTGGDGCLNAWLDFTDGSTILHDGDGDFNDTYSELGTDYPEHIFVNLPIVSGPHLLTFALPVGAVDAAGGARWYMRVRLTPRDAGGGCDAAEAYGGGGGGGGLARAAGALAPTQAESPTGPAQGGEVEDYVLNFTPTAVTLTGLEAQPSVGWLAGAALAALALLAVAATAWPLRRRLIP
jgi:hypothetical protein